MLGFKKLTNFVRKPIGQWKCGLDLEDIGLMANGLKRKAGSREMNGIFE